MNSRAAQIRIDGRTRTIRLRGVTARAKAQFLQFLYRLRAARRMNSEPDPLTLQWLGSLPDDMHAKIANLGLVEPRVGVPAPKVPTLRAWIDRRVAARTDWKPATRASVKSTGDLLVLFFGPNSRLDEITPLLALEWVAWLRSTPYRRHLQKTDGYRSRATIQSQTRNAKALFAAALAGKLIDTNPFAGFKSGSVAAARPVYVTGAQTASLIEACPSVGWRTLIGLARYGGLRVPSESHILTWADVDWGRGRLNVRSPKTAHWEGHEARAVPMTAALRRLLDDAYEAAQDGQICVLTLSRNNLRRMIGQIVTRAGVDAFGRPFCTLRQSCETEWSEQFPQHAVSAWMGHSEKVSRDHYLMIPDHIWELAAGADRALAPPASNRVQTSPNKISDVIDDKCVRAGNACFHSENRTTPGGNRTRGRRIRNPIVKSPNSLKNKGLPRAAE